MRNREISSEILLSQLRYNDGILYWKEWRRGRKRSLEAGTVNSKGYVKLTVDGVQIYAHRVVWIMRNGDIPQGMEIDHINHDRTDNRIENLRLVTRSINGRNLSMRSNNASGHIGIIWYENRGKYKVNVKVDGRLIYGGWHTCIESAISARDRLLIEHGFHENHGKEKSHDQG